MPGSRGRIGPPGLTVSGIFTLFALCVDKLTLVLNHDAFFKCLFSVSL